MKLLIELRFNGGEVTGVSDDGDYGVIISSLSHLSTIIGNEWLTGSHDIVFSDVHGEAFVHHDGVSPPQCRPNMNFTAC